MSKDNSYCGFRDLPKGKRWGTYDECFKKGQIRLWGADDYYELRRSKLDNFWERDKERRKDEHPGKERQINEKYTKLLVKEFQKNNRLVRTIAEHKKKSKDEVKDKINKIGKKFKDKL